MKKRILILGAGKIGGLIASYFAHEEDYSVHLMSRTARSIAHYCDNAPITSITLDATNPKDLGLYLSAHPFDAIVSALPYHCNPLVAELARIHEMNYFDLTEDIKVSEQIKALSQEAGQAFVPQCGLAPGFISILTHDIIQHFEEVEAVRMRVGALPLHPHNTLKYALNWSTEGLINEYGNPCQGIREGKLIEMLPLEGKETIEIDGLLYEAFNTSGGLGSLAQSYLGQVQRMDYKTLRYPGHCEKICFLMQDLKLNQDRETLKKILENAIPRTEQDVVLIYVSVIGKKKKVLMEETYFKKIYASDFFGQRWSAIQRTTAASLCAVVDLVLADPEQYQGLIGQERFSLTEFLNNRFGKVYQ